MQYPTPSDYQEAVQFPETAFAEPALQAATPDTNVLGLPQAITGAFAAVFPMNAPDGRWAVKCFLSDVADQQKRYRAIARHLEEAGLPYTVGFDYQPEGIQANGQAFPLLKMEWVEGTSLNRFVAQHLDDPEELAALSARWVELVATLEHADVAHGDMQHGNVLVAESEDGPRLRLVDYDTMYVPALKGRQSAEVGHRHYQHPDRTERDFGPHLDRFASLVIYTALHACRRQPSLWARYDTDENLLFRAADFYDPAASPLFEELGQIEALRPLAETLKTACYLEPEDVPALPEVLGDEDQSARLHTLQAARKRRTRRDGQVMRAGAARYFLPGLAVGVVVVVVLFAAGGWMPAAVGSACLIAGAGGAAWRHYRGLPMVRRRRRLRQETTHIERRIADLQRQIQALQAKRQKVQRSVDERRRERLQEIQEEVLYDRLKYHFVGEAKTVEGISHHVVVRLKAAGIRTAYGATPDRLRDVTRIGDRSRARVRMWRAGLVAQYEDEVPEELSPAEERRLARYVERRLADLDAEVERARAKIRVQSDERAEVQERARQVPAVSWSKYLRYLLHLDTLPEASASPPSRPTPAVAEENTVPAPKPPSDETSREPALPAHEQPWWKQKRVDA